MNKIKSIGILWLLMATGLWAQDAMVKRDIRVRPGWTKAKAAFENNWSSMSENDKSSVIEDFSDRIESLKPYVGDFKSDPNREDGGEAFYQAVSKMINNLRMDKTNARLAARIEEMISGAERLVEYRKTHVFTGKGLEPVPVNAAESNSGYSPLADGNGWVNSWVQDSAGDNTSNPLICQADTFLFAAVVRHLSEDYVTIYRSSDNGVTWSYWSGFYTPGYQSFPSSMVYDVQNNALLIAAYSGYNNGSVLFARYNDLNNSSDWDYVWGDDSTDVASQPQLSVEYTYSSDRICLFYHNNSTGNDVILESTDHGDTWTAVYVSSWTGNFGGAPKGAQGNNGGAGQDRFIYVTSLPDTNDLTVVTSASGLSGSWSATQLVDPYDRLVDDADISGSHSTTLTSTMVVYEAQYSADHRSIRGWFTPNIVDSSFIHFFIMDNIAYPLVNSPRVTTDGEWTDETPSVTDFYHIAYFIDMDGDSSYSIAARRVENNTGLIDSVDYWKSTETNEYFMGDSLGSITGNNIWDYATPRSFYAIDNTTFSTGLVSDPYVTSVVWMEYYNGGNIAVTSTPDISSGIKEGFSLEKRQLGMLYSDGSLKFLLSSDGIVSLKIYDIKGSLVETHTGNYKKGENSVSLTRVKRGMYFAVLSTNNVNRTFKFIAVK